MEKVKLLFVEDDVSFAYIIKGCLELSGLYEVATASNGKEGLEVYASFNPDIIVSDIEMPVLDGMKMVEQIRQNNESIPILLATARTGAQDVLDGYKLNIDNFIKKPFLPEELSAHIQAILKRVKTKPFVFDRGKIIIPIGKYSFNIDLQTLHWNNEIIRLTTRETKILLRLYERKGQLVSRESLLEELWGMNDFFTSRSLDVFINSLRKQLSRDPRIKIETIRGKGLELKIEDNK